MTGPSSARCCGGVDTGAGRVPTRPDFDSGRRRRYSAFVRAGKVAVALRPGLGVAIHGAALVLLALAVGCSGSASNREKLVDSLTYLVDAMRWQQWDQASIFVAPEARGAYIEAHESLADQIDVTDVEVTRRVAAPDGKTTTIVVSLSWLAKNDPVVKKTVLEQRWELRRSSWLIAKERRLRGDPLPAPPRRRRAPASEPASQPTKQPR